MRARNSIRVYLNQDSGNDNKIPYNLLHFYQDSGPNWQRSLRFSLKINKMSTLKKLTKTFEFNKWYCQSHNILTGQGIGRIVDTNRIIYYFETFKCK